MRSSGRRSRRCNGWGDTASAGAARALSAALGPLILGLVLAGCSPGENEILNPGTNRSGLSAPPETLVVGAPTADREMHAIINQGRTAVLRVARTDSVEAIAFLRFSVLPDTSGVTRAWLGLRWRGGEGTNLHLSAHRVVGGVDWTETGTTAPTPSFAESLAVEPLSSAAVTPRADSTLERRLLEIPMAVIKDWFEHPSDNLGIALRMTVSEPSASGTLDFLAREAVFPDSTGLSNPQLEFFQGDASAAIVAPTVDTWIYLDRRVPSTGTETTLRLSEWIPTRAVLQFPILDSLIAQLAGASPRDEDTRRLTVNRATLRLRLADFSDTSGFNLAVHRADPLADEAIEPDSLDLLSTLTTDIDAVLDPVRGEVRLEVGGLVRQMAAGATSASLVLRLTGEGSGSERLVIHSREAADSLRPMLDVVFTLPPDPRWGSEEVQP